MAAQIGSEVDSVLVGVYVKDRDGLGLRGGLQLGEDTERG
jgi:hypothetical protein